MLDPYTLRREESDLKHLLRYHIENGVPGDLEVLRDGICLRCRLANERPAELRREDVSKT